MKKILIATEKPFAASAVQKIRKIIEDAGFECVLLEKYTDKADFIAAVKNADALIIRSDIADREVLHSSDKLKIVVRAGAGYDNIDLDAATEKGIVAMNTPGQNSNAVAELALGMMVYHARNHFNGTSGKELRGKTLGLLAYGNVGKYVAQIAKGFGMELYAFDPYIPKTEIERDGIKAVSSIEELFSTCQYVSLHIPANEETKKSIHYGLLTLMPKNATLVNTARKEVVDEEALLSILEVRDDFHYLSDIIPDNSAELIPKYLERCFFTPKKMGAQTSEANINAGIAAANQIIDFFKHGNTTFQVNK